MTEFLEGLKPRVETVRVHIPVTGREENITVGVLTMFEWLSFEVALPLPPVPHTQAGPNNTKVPNFADRGWQIACEEIEIERNFRRLALALTKGGHDLSAHGNTLEDQSTALRGIDAGVATALINFLKSAAGGGVARVEERADTFRRNDPQHTKVDQSAQDHPE